MGCLKWGSSFFFWGIPCHMEPSDFLPAFFAKKVGRNVGFCLIPTFCTTFLPKMLEEKLYMMWPVKTDLPSEFSMVKSRALSRSVSSVLIFGACIYVPTSTLWRFHQTEKTALIPNVTHRINIIFIWCFPRKKAIIPLLLNRWFSLVGFGFFREKLWGISPWKRRFGASCSHVSLQWQWFSPWAPT